MTTASQISELDTLTGTIRAKLWIDAFWLPSQRELDFYERQQRDNDGVSEAPGRPLEWNLDNHFEAINACSMDFHEIVRQPKLQVVGGVTMWQGTVEIRGTFKQSLDLHAFPLDCHQLKIHLEMGSVKEMVYAPVKHAHLLSLNISQCPLYGWGWEGASIKFGKTDPSLSKLGNSYAFAEIRFKVARKWTPFVWRVSAFNTLITMASTLNFALVRRHTYPLCIVGFCFCDILQQDISLH